MEGSVIEFNNTLRNGLHLKMEMKRLHKKEKKMKEKPLKEEFIYLFLFD